METAVQELIKLIEKLSPELWRIALGQVRVNAVREVLLIALLALGSAGCVWLARWAWRSAEALLTENQEAKIDMEIVLFLLVAVVGLLCATRLLAGLNALIQYTLNPEYAAIQVLVDLVR